MIEIAITIGFLMTFGLFITAIAISMVTEQRKNRSTMRQLEREFQGIAMRLGDEAAGLH